MPFFVQKKQKEGHLNAIETINSTKGGYDESSIFKGNQQ